MAEQLRDLSQIQGVKSFTPSPEGKELCSDIKTNFDVRLDYVEIGDFYERLSNPSPTSLSLLSESFVACPGGTNRSPRIGKYLDRQGVILSDKRCTKGFTILDLSKLVKDGSIDKNGFITPNGFENPIKVLILPLDIKYQCSNEEVLSTLVSSFLHLKSKNPNRNIKLNILIINGGENDSRKYHREYYQEDLGYATEQGPNSI